MALQFPAPPKETAFTDAGGRITLPWLAWFGALRGFLLAANNLGDLSSATTSRTNLGLGTAATADTTAFDAAGAAAAAQAASDPLGSAAAVLASSLQKASNLSDLASAGTSRTNLGLGTAATHAATDFDLALAYLSWAGDVAAGGHNIAGLGNVSALSAQITSYFNFSGSMFYLDGAGTYFRTNNNASNWQEFAFFDLTGANAGLDAWGLYVNARTTLGGADAWFPVLAIAAQTGATQFNVPVVVTGPLTLTGGLNTPLALTQGGTGAATAAAARTNLGLGTSATTAATAYDASGAASAVQALAVLKSNNLSDVVAATARTNLGLVASATTDTTNAANISSGTLPAGRLPNPSASTLGGVESLAAVASKWLNAISTAGVPSATQPAFSDISGTAATGQIPTLNQNTSGTAANVTGVVALVNGGTGTAAASAAAALTALGGASLTANNFVGQQKIVDNAGGVALRVDDAGYGQSTMGWYTQSGNAAARNWAAAIGSAVNGFLSFHVSAAKGGNPLGAAVLTLSSGGNTLVNTTTDNGTDKLQVSGSINATSYRVGAVAGASGTLTIPKLTTANGSLTFVNGIITAFVQPT